MKFLIFALVFIGFNFALASETRNKVEELFLWKISDELKLSVPEEKALGEIIHTQNQIKNKLNEQTQENIKALSEAEGDLKKVETLISQYKKLMKEYSDLALDEIEKVQKKLGTKKTAQYLVLKNDLTNKLKTLLAKPEKETPPAVLPSPKIIEEK